VGAFEGALLGRPAGGAAGEFPAVPSDVMLCVMLCVSLFPASGLDDAVLSGRDTALPVVCVAVEVPSVSEGVLLCDEFAELRGLFPVHAVFAVFFSVLVCRAF
jgi:hypothetical protein